MERTVALKRLAKVLGKSMRYRVDPSAPDADERTQARVKANDFVAEYKAAEEALSARVKAVLGADTEYQRLKGETTRLRKARDKAFSMSHHFKFTVGTDNGMFFVVKAQGDSWEEVIAKLNGK